MISNATRRVPRGAAQEAQMRVLFTIEWTRREASVLEDAMLLLDDPAAVAAPVSSDDVQALRDRLDAMAAATRAANDEPEPSLFDDVQAERWRATLRKARGLLGNACALLEAREPASNATRAPRSTR